MMHICSYGCAHNRSALCLYHHISSLARLSARFLQPPKRRASSLTGRRYNSFFPPFASTLSPIFGFSFEIFFSLVHPTALRRSVRMG